MTSISKAKTEHIEADRLQEIVDGFTGLDVCAPIDRLGPEETLAIASELLALRTDQRKDREEGEGKPDAWALEVDINGPVLILPCFLRYRDVEMHKAQPGHHNDVFRPLYSSLSAKESPEQLRATHRHKKRGSEYVLLGYGKMQAENWLARAWVGMEMPGASVVKGESADMHEVAIYRSVDDGSLWVRPREEFEDGRFIPLSTGGGQ